MILILTLFACVSGAALALVFMLSSPLIEANMLEELRKSIFLVVPDAKNYEEKKSGEISYFECTDGAGNPVGIAFPVQGNGYQGVIKIMVGLTPDLGTITGIKVLEQVETPGLGGRIGEAAFQDQFKGVLTDPAVEYVKNQKPENKNQIQAITGATISSRSVVNIINENVSLLKDVL
jgi:electron transport complex protein RnfG